MKARVLRWWMSGWLLVIMVTGFCGAPTEEELIFDHLRDLAGTVEDGDLTAAMTYISLEYHDARERTYADIEGLIGGYLEGHPGIVIHILDGEIQDLQPDSASLQVDISASSGIAQKLRKVISVSGYLVRLSLELEKNLGIWQVRAADWEIISRDQLFPGSQKLLKELFPVLQ